jgi:small-conductance mechanosensitive channel
VAQRIPGAGTFDVMRLAVLLLAAALSLGAAPAHGDDAGEGMAGWSVVLLEKAKARIAGLQESIARAPAETRKSFATIHASLMTGAGVRGFTYAMILLLVGVGTEWLYWTYAYGSLRALYATPSPPPRVALRLGLRRLALRGAGLLLFGAAILGTSAVFSWPAGVHNLVVAATLLVLVLRFAWVAIGVVLSPARPVLRLVPVPAAHTRALATVAMAASLLLAIGQFVPDALDRVGGTHHAGAGLRFIAFTLAALILAAAAFAFFGAHGGRPAASARRLPVFPKSFVLAALVMAVHATWLMSDMAAAVAAIAAVVIALQLGLRPMVFFFWSGASGDPGAAPSIALSATRFAVVLAGVGAGALLLDTPLAALAATESPALRIGLRLLGVATLALLTHVIWIGVRTVIDERLAAVGPADPHHPPDASSRLLTLLPLMRITTAVLLLVMLALSSLWALGIEITPLLAGAGVVGIAIGFGAQALVRDVIAGVFFLAEDAFRVGEYIESGTSIKGNVERITLRSVALRHHNGPLHFVPYGALGTVRNTSRDWVIDKFNLPLPIGVESEKIRKMIKKVGEQMQADPEIGPHIIEPLKGKLYRVDPGVKIFRCKFRSPPGKQFDVRAQALKRIEAALKEMGVGFADGLQTVVVQPAPSAP